jgi:uncharacterized protein (TIGR03067 family)
MRMIGLLGLVALGLALAPLGVADEKKADGAKLDAAKLEGKWQYVSADLAGKKKSADDLKKGHVEITKDNIYLKSPDGDFTIKYKLDASKKPAQVEMEITKGPVGEGAKGTGIIELKDKELKLCYPAMGGETPKTFAAPEGSGNHLIILKRKK